MGFDVEGTFLHFSFVHEHGTRKYLVLRKALRILLFKGDVVDRFVADTFIGLAGGV